MRRAIKQVKTSENPCGRPTKQESGIEQKVQEYLDQCIDVADTKNKTKSVNLPSVEKFAKYLKVSRDTLYTWANDKAEYRQALNAIKSEQRDRLIDNGLAGNYNSAIVKLILASNHGMREQKELNDKHDMFGFIKQIYARADEIELERHGKAKLS